MSGPTRLPRGLSLAIAIALSAPVAVAAPAQELRPMPLAFTGARAFECEFQPTTRRDLTPSLEPTGGREIVGSIRLDSFDDGTAAARQQGPAASGPVRMVRGTRGITFIHTTDTSGVVAVSIAAVSAKGMKDAYPAAWSRHMFSHTGEAAAMQATGVCRAVAQ